MTIIIAWQLMASHSAAFPVLHQGAHALFFARTRRGQKKARSGERAKPKLLATAAAVDAAAAGMWLVCRR
ncbi:MAG: hypothetical protein V4582_21360 [Pseudomonadota bacterium]